MIHDISPLLSTRTEVWPGDKPLKREVIVHVQQNAQITVSALSSTVHLGAHADAPAHFLKEIPLGLSPRQL